MPDRTTLIAVAAALGAGVASVALVAVFRPVGDASPPEIRSVSPSAIPEEVARVLRLPGEERLEAVTAILIDAAEEPDRAIALARGFCRDDPELVRDHGNTLVSVLCAQESYEAALCFAELGGPERSEWLVRTLRLWAVTSPVDAARAALAQPGGEGFFEVSAEWAQREPAALAEFAWRLPDGPNRRRGIEDALASWLQVDPTAAATWMSRKESSAALDTTAAALALNPSIARHRPDIAAAWASEIVDGELRRKTLVAVVDSWSRLDRTSARGFVESDPALSEPDRAALRPSINRPPD